MFGKNKILKPQNHAGDYLDIQEIFLTLQGEGPYAGWPAIFIRLGGCNLACSFCDTEFESYQKMTLETIIKKIKDLLKQGPNTKLAVITGGEPLRQPIKKLCQKLEEINLLVQIETNGTLNQELTKNIKIICSPKVTNNKYHQIRSDLLPKINAFKFIISASNSAYQNIAEIGQQKFKTPIYIQPMDEYNDIKNKANLELSKKLCLENGYFLSLQTHKIIDIR